MILIIIEHNKGILNTQSLEILSLAKGLGKVEAIVIGDNGRSLASDLGQYGIEVVHLIVHNDLQEYAPAAWGKSIVQLVESLQPKAIMAIGTERGNEVMAHIGAQLEIPMVANCTQVKFNEDSCSLTRIRWGGSLLETAKLTSNLYLLTIIPHINIVENGETRTVKIIVFQADLIEKDLHVRVIGEMKPETGKVLLTDAQVVVSGGRGVGSKEGFASLEELAKLLGGAIGCSRVVTNNGWRPHADQIGQTGARIAPELYIACGISGAIQHWVGCKSSKKIMVINTDKEAPIVAKADYAIVGDLHNIVPEINRLLKERRSSIK